MRRIKLLLSYDGTPYLGWQKQPNGNTVQGEIERVLSKIYDHPITVIASGRTDAGTHAVAQVAHFDAPKIWGRGEHLLQRTLNSLLPNSIVVKGAWLAPENFHAMLSVERKTYTYRIWNHPTRSALWAYRALWVPESLDLELLNSISQPLLGEHDFKSFQSSGTPVPSTIRHIEKAEWRHKSAHLLEFSIQGRGFLKQMVRNIVGTVLYIHQKGGGAKELKRILEACNRQMAKDTAPAHGLYLRKVEYPRKLDNKCRKL